MNGNWRKRIGFGLVVAFILAAVTGGLAQIAFYQKIALGTTPCMLSAGSGTPESAVTGSPCDVFLRTDGAAGSTLYVKESGSATNTGWGAVGTGGELQEYKEAARCAGASALTFYDVPNAASAAAAACDTGTYQNRGVLDYTDGANHTSQISFHLPNTFDATQSVTLDVYWKTTATAGNAIWNIQTKCLVIGAASDAAWNAAQNITSAAGASAGLVLRGQQAGLTMTGCVADSTLWIKIDRDGAVGGDTIAATATLIGTELEYQVKW